MPLSLLYHSALALFAQRTRIPTSARSIGFCAIWVCISSRAPLVSRFAVMQTTRDADTGDTPRQLLAGWRLLDSRDVIR